MNTGASWPSFIEAGSRVLAMQTKLHQWANAIGMSTWRAGCGESRTSGSEGGPEKPIVRKARRRSGPTLHVGKDGDGISVPGGGAGCLEPAGGGLVDGQPPAHRAGAGCAEHGDLAAATAGRGAPQRPRLAVHLDRVRGALQGGWRAAVDRLGGRCVRQRTVRELLRDSGVRAAGSAQLSQPRRGAPGDLRVRRGLLQSAPSFSAASRSAGWSPSEPASLRPATVFATGARRPERPPDSVIPGASPQPRCAPTTSHSGAAPRDRRRLRGPQTACMGNRFLDPALCRDPSSVCDRITKRRSYLSTKPGQLHRDPRAVETMPCKAS